LDFGKIPDVTSLIPLPTNNSSPGFSFGNPRRKDPSTVFVAGATGQSGIRIAQTLLREGFSVRAGVPELASAQELARLAAQYKVNPLHHSPLQILIAYFKFSNSDRLKDQLPNFFSTKLHISLS